MTRMRRGIAIPVLLVLEACTPRQPAAPPAATNKAAPAAADGTSELCLTLANGRNRAAGAQVDIGWDAACMEPVSRKNGAPDCTANPASGKQANAHVNGASMRVLFFSMSDTNPIPDGRLFCCRFRMTASTRSCCSLVLSKLIVSDPKGKRISDTSVSYQATLNGTQCATLHP